MHKHSLSVPVVPASAPTSPAATRLNRTERIFGLPVTPQRIIRPQKTLYRSPVTPASTNSTPYTPLSLRSFSTSSGSSLNTPDSVTSFKRFPVIHSPENETASKLADKKLADIAANWRSRANENGIRVATAEESSFGDDEASDLTPSDASSTPFVNEESVLSPPFLPNHRRSRTQSSIHPICPSASSNAHRTPARRALGILNTPPPKPTNASQLKFKGSMTDPAHTRRRPSFGQITTELFDIDENAFEPYPQSFSSATQQLVLQDPFNGSGLSTIAESIPQHFDSSYSDMFSDSSATSPQSCSVCGRHIGNKIAVLVPCHHVLCSACLTSALNIVGEKDMQCSVCRMPVGSFDLQSASSDDEASTSTVSQRRPTVAADIASSPLQQRSARGDYTLFPNTVNPRPLPSLMSALSLRDNQTRFASTSSSIPQTQRAENSVLRIDNVPWDITPPVVAAWLKHPVVRVHVLLDYRAKTLSHAYIEVATESIAQAALRSLPNSVLGTGHRARGVTVTRSSQEELMHALFPSWKGKFEGARPSLAGLSTEQLSMVLKTGLMSKPELDALLQLIQNPDVNQQQFLKAPSLPFHMLMSILSKFPSDPDSTVFWTNDVRDTLFVVTHSALNILCARYRTSVPQDEPGLLDEFWQVAINCRVFTQQQSEMLRTIHTAYYSPIALRYTLPPAHAQPAPYPFMQAMTPPASYNEMIQQLCFSAREFGIPEDVLNAFVQRVSGGH